GSIPPDSESALAFVCFRSGIPREIYEIVRRADWWASAADRPQWPRGSFPLPDGRTIVANPPEAQVRWTERPVLIHPLCGELADLEYLGHTDVEQIKQHSFGHFAGLLEEIGAGKKEEIDWKKAALALWRFGPEIGEEQDAATMGELWKLLPADTRVPDHTIWDHLDLVSAFAGAFAADPNGEAALLAMSIGPVQSFIAAARKTEDLWAGSHLLARLAWETMKPLCEELGPDAILFPRLRGIPQVDLWLQSQAGLPKKRFEALPWWGKRPDANPLFAAALPNRFVAVVPASRAEEIARKCRDHVRQWLLDLGLRVVDRLLEEAGLREQGAPRSESVYAYGQVRRQLADFPEVHWAVTPFSLAKPREEEKQTDPDTTGLKAAMAPFFGTDASQDAGFLASPAWKVLQKHIRWPDGTAFFDPNPGVLYPAFYELNERVMAAAKSVRPFTQSAEEGWRCTLTGETEWLTHDAWLLTVPRGQRRSRQDEQFREGQHHETLWTRIADRRPAWAKQGEHLGALPAIKRLWPTLFAEEVRECTGGMTDRFIVSTHAMALAHQIRQWLESGAPRKEQIPATESRVALPAQLAANADYQAYADHAARLPAVIEEARDRAEEDEEALSKARRLVRRVLFGDDGVAPELENYYALVMMDGDHMGAILAGDEEAGTSIPFLESFHPQVRPLFERKTGELEKYAQQRRPVSPNRHLVISGALNDFSQSVVPWIVEREYAGRIIYAGGDDVLAMLPVADALPAAARLRAAYSGAGQDELPRKRSERWNRLMLAKGFAYLNGRLMRMMGPRATASCGLVIAHHQTPLSLVLRELRDAEKRAKQYRRDGNGRKRNRDAWHISVLKRSGGRLDLSGDWGEPLALLRETIEFLASPEVSRRAVYNSLEWLHDLPCPTGSPDRQQLGLLLAYQMERQTDRPKKALARRLAGRLVDEAMRHGDGAIGRLRNFLCVAEFLAREQRAAVPAAQEPVPAGERKE
ncbi:MAG: type III-B CRISPR-associated protein Cas10/Cmr2, partial [Bryobacteraceae bacterium]|nr:type III-B CRISPR-associated protein Cas10/Cmr2 [Bryobacteraceae bacterium]